MTIQHLAAAFCAGILSLSAHAVPASIPTAADVNARLGFARSGIIQIDVADAPGIPQRAVVAIEGEVLTLDLWPVSVRADGYRVYTAGADEVLHEVEAAPERTFRGEVLGVPGSIVAASILSDGLYARIERGPDTLHWIEPLAPHFPERMDLAGFHVVYADCDAPDTGGVCATVARHMAKAEPELAPGKGAGGSDGEMLYEAELACDADREYYQDYGSSTVAVEERIHAVINQMNVQYERDVMITHRISRILIRTTQVYTTTDPGALLTQFRQRWNDNHGAVPRDVAHLFTGKEIQGSVIGIAFLGVICNLPAAYGLVQSDFNGVFSCATDLSAHELGHNWDAGHCDCPNNTMHPSIQCANVFTLASIHSIVEHRDSRDCLELVDPKTQRPPNDTCVDAESVSDGLTPFDTTGATTDGPGLPAECNEGAGLDFVNDIWFSYSAPCTGPVLVNLCNSTFDTRLAVYRFDGTCPGTIEGCNDDACGIEGLRSDVDFVASAGTLYLIRVGAYEGSGTGNLSILCFGPIECPEDVDGDGMAGFNDILRILATWGPCGGCPEDVDGDGMAGFNDILRILAAWGPCP